MELVSPTTIDETIAVLKKEIAKTHTTDTEKSPEYRQMLVSVMHTCVIKFPEISGTVVQVLIDFLDDSNATSASDVVLFVREVVESYPRLRELVVTRIIESFSTIKVPKVFRIALWILAEYTQGEDEFTKAMEAIRHSLGSLPLMDQETLQAAEDTSNSVPKKGGPAVLADGTYASQSSMGAPAGGGKTGKFGEPVSLRSLITGGDFYLATVAASSMTKLVQRMTEADGERTERVNELVAEVMSYLCAIIKVGSLGVSGSKMDDDCTERLWLCLMFLSDPTNEQLRTTWIEECRASYATLLVAKRKSVTVTTEKEAEEKKKIKAHADDVITFRQLRGKGQVVTELEDEDALDLSRATGLGDGEDFASRLKRVTQLTGLSDPVYAEAVVTVHDYDIVLDVLIINQLNEHLSNLCLELATVGDLKLCERPQTFSLAPHAQIQVRANIKVSSTETGIVYGNIVYDTGEESKGKDGNSRDAQNMVILNDIHIDIMDYITPAHCSLLQFRQMWAEFEWENKVAINTSISDPVKYLRHIVSCTNMKCLTHIEDDAGECGFLAANLYARSIFGEDALVNVCMEKQRDNTLSGNLRIRSKTQGIALSLGDKITLKQKATEPPAGASAEAAK
jgi:coatomer subunit beta